MENIEIIGFTRDFRTDTSVVYVQVPINNYLEWVGGSFENTDFQRKREKHKAYRKMKEDIKQGAILPPITLALKPEYIQQDLLQAINEKNISLINTFLTKKDALFILDGLQRTYILQDVKNEQTQETTGKWEQQKLLVEIWLENKIENLIYRFFVLNAGQKAMTPRHQLDVIFSGLKRVLETELNIELLSEKERKRRTKPKQFQTKDIATSYACFSLADYAPDKDNLIVQQLQDEKLLLATDLGEGLEYFKMYLKKYAELDELCFSHYETVEREAVKDSDEAKDAKDAKNFFDNEYAMNAFFALIGEFLQDNDLREGMNQALEKLKTALENKDFEYLGLETYQAIKGGFSSAKKNLGLIYKSIIHSAFDKFFKKSGTQSLNDCWLALKTNGKITLRY